MPDLGGGTGGEGGVEFDTTETKEVIKNHRDYIKKIQNPILKRSR